MSWSMPRCCVWCHKAAPSALDTAARPVFVEHAPRRTLLRLQCRTCTDTIPSRAGDPRKVRWQCSEDLLSMALPAVPVMVNACELLVGEV